MRIAKLFALTAAVAAAFAQPAPDRARTKAELDRLLGQIQTYEYGQSRAALAQLTSLLDGSQGSPALLKEIEARLLAFLQSPATPAAKSAVLKELSAFATEASVPVLAPMLAQAELAEQARYALARIPGPAADTALRKALEEAFGKIKIEIISSIGQRRDAEAVLALRGLLASSEPEIAAAAITALGDIGNRAALSALASAREKSSGARRQQISEAYLRCAENDKSTALKVYRQLNSPEESEMIRIAALSGMAALEGKGAASTLAAEIGSNDPRIQAAAIRLLAAIPGAETTAAMMRAFPNLNPAGQVRLVTALAVRGDAAALPLLLQAVKSGDAAVRIAALAGLGKLGNEASVPVLAQAAASGTGAEQAAARQSLAGMAGAGIDSAIVAAIGSANGKMKAELLMAAGERRSSGAGKVLIQAVRDPDAEVRRAALRALKNVAGPAEVPALLEIVKGPEGADRKDAAQALAAALKKSDSAQVGAVISAYQAAPPIEVRLALLEALGQSSKDEALPVLREALKDSRPEIARSAILALTDWMTAAPLPDLLAMAKSSPDQALQTLSLRGLLKLMAAPSGPSNVESARLLGEAMRLARDPAEKRTVLSLLAAHPSDESLKLAEASLNDAAVANEAKVSVQRIRNALKSR